MKTCISHFHGVIGSILLMAVIMISTGCKKEDSTVEGCYLLPGKFSVAQDRQVRFTRGNLYWDGSAFHFETCQTAYAGPSSGTAYDVNHVGHFFWTKTASASYAASYGDGECTVSDSFFADYNHKLTVDGQSGLYVLSCGSTGEWNYLFSARANALNLYKKHVTVNGVPECLVIAPDDFTGTLYESYDASSWEDAEDSGIVCLPPSGYRNGTELFSQGCGGGYLSSTPSSSDVNLTYGMYFPEPSFFPTDYDSRSYGYAIRLVCSVSD